MHTHFQTMCNYLVIFLKYIACFTLQQMHHTTRCYIISFSWYTSQTFFPGLSFCHVTNEVSIRAGWLEFLI